MTQRLEHITDRLNARRPVRRDRTVRIEVAHDRQTRWFGLVRPH